MGPESSISWIDPTHVIAVGLIEPRAKDELDGMGWVMPWRVYVTLDTGQRDCVYRNLSRAHAEAVAVGIAACALLYDTGGDDDVHVRSTPPVDPRLTQEPWRHSTLLPPPTQHERQAAIVQRIAPELAPLVAFNHGKLVVEGAPGHAVDLAEVGWVCSCGTSRDLLAADEVLSDAMSHLLAVTP